MEQKFVGRMMAYSKRIREVSLEAEIKLQMKAEKGKLIYPRQIKKELGAKLIYDAICPVATGAFYNFDPYEREYGDVSMVAESTTSYGTDRCSQIAEVAINIENYIKKLNDTELQDSQIVKVILKQCFEGMPDIALTKYKIAIFCDGEFFHGKDWEVLKPKLEKSNNGEYWISKISRNRERDDEVNKRLMFEGWTVIRFWGNDIKKHVNE